MNVALAPSSAAKVSAATRLPLARLGSALLLAPPAVAAIWFGSPFFETVVTFGALVLSYEWWRLCGNNSRLAAAVLALGIVSGPCAAALGQMPYAFAAIGIASLMLVALGGNGARSRTWLAAGPLYLGLPCALLIWLRADEISGRESVLWLFLVVWASDIGAYLVGRGLGGPRLAPRISPQKTWSGAVGGLVTAAIVGCLAALAFGHEHPVRALGIAVLFSLIAQAGDLANRG